MVLFWSTTVRVPVCKFSGTILDVANFHHRTGAYQNAATQTDDLDPAHVHGDNEETEEADKKETEEADNKETEETDNEDEKEADNEDEKEADNEDEKEADNVNKRETYHEETDNDKDEEDV